MDPNESNEGSLSITESSQEWHVLNLLRVGERELFETNLQEFRKIQLTESQDGKVRLCKLINEVLRLDPQYSIILVEDLSHLFNDSNFVVQKYALFSIADSLNILFTYIVASNTLVESIRRFGRLEAGKTSNMGRCRRGQNGVVTNGVHQNNGTKAPESGEMDEHMPFSVDNSRVFESFSDFSCIRFMAHIRLLEECFSDVKYRSLHSLHYLIHTRNRFYSVNLLKLLFYELANYPNYLCRQCTDDTHKESSAQDNVNKSGKGTKDKRKVGSKVEEDGWDMHDTLYKWHAESVQLLQHLISSYLEHSKRDKHKNGDHKGKSQKNMDKNGTNEDKRTATTDLADENEVNIDESKLVRCVLSSEVASSLITFYPDYYFHAFIDYLVPLLTTSHSVVFENILFRIFSSEKCVNYHHHLLEKVNRYGYNLDLKEVYKLVQTLPSRYRENSRGSMVVIDKNEDSDKNKLFETTDKLVSSHNVEVDVKLNEYPAAQLFEFDKELVKNYRKIKNTQIKINKNFYKNKPAELTQILYPTPYKDNSLETEVNRRLKSDRYRPEDGEEYRNEYDEYSRLHRDAKELKTVTDVAIAQNEKLYVRLVGCQMIDTVATYKRFLRFEVISPNLVNFDVFSKGILNHFLLSNIVEFENRREVLCNLLNYVAEYILINHADLTFFRQNREYDEMTYGLKALFAYVNHVRDVDMFVKYLNRLNSMVTYSYTTNLAKSLVSYRNLKAAGEDYYMKMYENFVNLSLSYVCEFLSEMDEYSDFCVHALSKFVLNLPKVPSRIADLIVLWVNSDKQGNVKLAFSLVSNLLKLSETVTRVDVNSMPGSGYYKYTSNLSFVRRSIFVVFLSCITSGKPSVSELFLKLISSQRGLYNNSHNYTLKSLESLHNEFVEKLERLKDSKDDLYEDCVYLSSRPLWQWPTKLVELLCKKGKYKALIKLSEATRFSVDDEGLGDYSSDIANRNGSHHSDTHTRKLKVDMYYDGNDEEEVNDDIGVWIEESVTLMAIPNSLKTSKFIHNTANNLIKSSRQNKRDGKDEVSGFGDDMRVDGASEKFEGNSEEPNNQGKDDAKIDVDDSDEELVIHDDDEANAVDNKEGDDQLEYVYFEPMLECCSKNSRLVFRLADLANRCIGSQFYSKCSQTLSRHPKELQILIKYSDEYSEFVESALEETRKMWSDLMFKYDERSSLDKELMLLLILKMESVPEYLIQMSPFLSRDQLDGLMVFLFRNYEKEKLVKILDIIIETPKIALPQHFLYSTYNFQIATTASPSDKERDYMKLQISLLDTCITYCTHGKFSVESAISSLYLIVESFENINFVFGRLLCQFVQKIPLTRKVIVDVIFPKLIQKQCWQDKQLFKGVVLSICTLWNQFRDHLMRYILEMPNSNVKMVLKALHTQHNISEYMKSSIVPSNIQALFEDVAATTLNKPA